MPEPPAFLNEPAIAEWQRLAPELYHLGLLTVADTTVFAAYCQACGLWQLALAAERAANERETAEVLAKVAASACRDMVKYGAHFGLTPASRARLSVD